MKRVKTSKPIRGKKKRVDEGTVDLTTLFLGDQRSVKERIRHVGILFEDLHTKMDHVIEGMDSTRKVLEDRIDGVEQRLGQRLDVVEAAVTHNSKEIKGVRATQEEHGRKLDALQNTVDGHTATLDEHGKKLDDHTARLDSIDSKLDRFGSRLDDHEGRITSLETVPV